MRRGLLSHLPAHQVQRLSDSSLAGGTSIATNTVGTHRKHLGLKIAGSVVLVLFVIGTISHTKTSATLKPGVATHQSTKTPAKTVSKTPTRQEPTATVPSTTPSKPAQPVVLQTESGKGQGSEPKFTVPSSANGWTLTTTYNCQAFG